MAEAFRQWLEDNSYLDYRAGLEEQGYDGLDVLADLSDDELMELAASLKMKPGHRRRLPLAVKKVKQLQRKAQMDREDAEEERVQAKQDAKAKRALAKQDAEEDRVEERKLAKQERQKKAAAMDPGTEQTLAADKPGEVLLPAHKTVSACVHLRAAV